MTIFYVLATLLLTVDVQAVLAQVTTAITPTTETGNLGTTVTTQGQTVQITGGTRPGDGTNLFHSFDQFNVGRADTAQFLNTTPSLLTSNILGRVTGGNPSNIFGTIQTTGFGNANLFLMNPAGIVFGPNATLNVGGSVAFTTADYLRLASADGSNSGIFHADPIAVNLLTSAPITAFGFLGPNPSALTVEGSILQLPLGQSLSLVGGNLSLKGAKLLTQSGHVNLASVASSGEIPAETLLQTTNNIGEGDDGVHIRGGQLVVDNSMVSATAGDITLDADSILITNGTEIATSTKTAANAGHVFIRTSGNIKISSGSTVGSRSDDNATGHSGNVLLSSSHGDIRFADAVFVSTQAKETSRGDAGRITIEAPNGDILLTNLAFIFNTASGTGTLRGIRLTANNLLLDGSSQISGDNFTPLTGESIDITLKSNLTLAGGSSIATGSFERPNKPNLIVDSADVNIKASDILITDNSLLFAGTSTTGAGGIIRMSATNQIVMTNGALISAESAGTGDAGDISINAGQRLEMRDSSIKTEAKQAGGGNIDIQAIDRVHLVNSTISTSVLDSNGNSGNISIDPNVVALQNSQVLAQAVQGAGGNIVITTPLFLADSNSVIDASSQFGLNGTVTARSNLTVGQGALTSKPIQAHSLLTQRCAALVNNGQISSFVVAGREQLPSDPGGWLTSPLTFATLGESLDADHTVASTQATMPIADHDTGTVSLRRLTPAGFLMANFAESEATGCRS